MKKRLAAGLAIGLTMVGMTIGEASAMIVTPTNDGTTLVNAILGTGITVTPGSINYSGANNAASGTFTNGGNIGIASGIIMTTGDAAGAEGPNNTGSYSGAGMETSLSFSFTTSGGDLFLKYFFASEEYNEFVGSQFNDTFSFMLDGTNIALIPGTMTAITINNVNSGLNSSFYRNNSPGPYDTQFDGLTTVLTAQALNLAAGQHTIVLSISDIGDTIYDSGVFIQGKTFSDSETPIDPIPEPATLLLFGTGLAGLAAVGRRKRS